MPVYTYRCGNCGSETDHNHNFNDPPLTKCPVCGEDELHRVYKPVGIVFKGSGFYATDNRSASGIRNGRASSSKSEESEETKSSKKADESSSTVSKTKTAEKT